MIKLTTSDGKEYEIKNFQKIGDYLKVRYTNNSGEELIYWIRITNGDKLVMN